LAPFLLSLVATVIACGSPALTPNTASRAPVATAAGDIQEVSLEISALM
jgi:hypothetical protein